MFQTSGSLTESFSGFIYAKVFLYFLLYVQTILTICGVMTSQLCNGIKTKTSRVDFRKKLPHSIHNLCEKMKNSLIMLYQHVDLIRYSGQSQISTLLSKQHGAKQTSQNKNKTKQNGTYCSENQLMEQPRHTVVKTGRNTGEETIKTLAELRH